VGKSPLEDCEESCVGAYAAGVFAQNAWIQWSVIVVSEGLSVSEPRTWMCLICGWIYDEAAGDPEHGLAPGTRWSEVPMNWTCPECGARKEDFEMVQV